MKVATKTTMIGVLLISTLGLTGCATVFLPSQQPIALKSDNPNTSYYQNNKYVGHGKSTSFELMRDHTTTITAKAPGCKPVTITTKQRFNKLALMNIFNDLSSEFQKCLQCIKR